MRHLLSALLAALLACGPVLAEEWKKVRIATEGAYAPWNFKNADGKLVGFELDLAEALCERMNVECEIVEQAWDGIIPALMASQYDVIMAGMSITEKRKKTITFSRSYAATPALLVVAKDSESAEFSSSVEFLNLDEVDEGEEKVLDELRAEFKGKTIGVQTATTHENFLREFLGDAVDIRPYEAQEKLNLDLQAGGVDAALASASYWVPLLKTDEGQDMKMIGPGLTGGPFGAGVGAGVRKEDQDLADLFSKAIDDVLADGTCQKLSQHWFGFDSCPNP